jgi:hypothetical protein
MPARLRPRLTYANVVSTLCLFIVLGGSSYAAVTLTKNTVRSKHIKNGEVKRPDVAGNAIDSAKVRNGSLLNQDFAPGQLPAGPPGQAGAPGAAGAPGGTGQQGEAGLSGLEQVSAASVSDSVSPKSAVATCPAGKRAISGAADINSGTFGSSPDQVTHVVITNSGSPSSEATVPGTFFARAHEIDPAFTGNWNVQVRGICANASP